MQTKGCFPESDTHSVELLRQEIRSLQEQLLQKDLLAQDMQQKASEAERQLQVQVQNSQRHAQQLSIDLRRSVAEVESLSAKFFAERRQLEATHAEQMEALNGCVDALKSKNDQLEADKTKSGVFQTTGGLEGPEERGGVDRGRLKSDASKEDACLLIDFTAAACVVEGSARSGGLGVATEALSRTAVEGDSEQEAETAPLAATSSDTDGNKREGEDNDNDGEDGNKREGDMPTAGAVEIGATAPSAAREEVLSGGMVLQLGGQRDVKAKNPEAARGTAEAETAKQGKEAVEESSNNSSSDEDTPLSLLASARPVKRSSTDLAAAGREAISNRNATAASSGSSKAKGRVSAKKAKAKAAPRKGR
ncbi:hypothetical protein cyc_04682 [Cyclospora cayetanensis]|uniref:Uncharacterized protein n=1 Tax=Cyclospora cayetanensis TaxID=88456 RepID=A0A1D3CRG0_9EIME|nr:hypothetical protein cyc_04682 [Cyclospora cayetanensis]